MALFPSLFSAPTEPAKSLETTEKTLILSKEFPCLKLTKEMQTTKERKDRAGSWLPKTRNKTVRLNQAESA